MKVGNWRLALGLFVTATAFGAGCAQDVGDIDRTQADKLDKALFDNDDEWYFRQTVVDTDFQGSVGLFNAAESSLKRVRWVITEDMLYAMSTVEPVEGVTQGYTNDDDRRVGIVAAFPIHGHFDIQRSYNSATGEQANVITENGSDHEWYDRKFFRVDWSTNLADGMGLFGSAAGSMAAATFDIPQDDENIHPNRTRISDSFIDTVTQYHYEPDIYACYYAFGLDSIYSCEGGNVQVRNSFLKAPTTKTYQPLDYLDTAYLTNDDGTRLMTMRLYDPDLNSVFEVGCDERALEFERNEFGSSPVDSCEPATFDMFSRFGYFRTERTRWSEDLGADVEANRLYYANRWNIWESMYDADGTLLEMKDRAPKPITYHLNVEYPRDMIAGADEVARQWDVAFKQAVLETKRFTSVADLDAYLLENYGHTHMYQIVPNDCSASMLQKYYDENGDVAGLFSEIASGQSVEDAFWGLSNQDKLQFCANLEAATPNYNNEGTGAPHYVGGVVKQYKEGKAFEFQRVGDLRYSFFNWVEQDVPWLGYGPSAADPVTGQIISGNANFNGTAIRTYGPIAADYIQYMNGELKDETLAFGEHIRAWLKEQQSSSQTQGQGLSPEGKREMARRVGLRPSEVSATNFEEAPSLDQLPQMVRKLGPKGMEAEARRLSESMVLAKSSDTRAAEFYGEPEVRNMLMQDSNFRYMVESAAIVNHGPEFDDADVEQTYLDLTSPRQAVDRYQRRNQALAQRNIFSLEYMEDMITNLVTYSGVADHFKGESREKIGRFFIDRMFVGTQLHEVGHTVGLRHNFIASTDALNYHDTYWDIQAAIADGAIAEEDRWSVPNDVVADIAPDGKVGDKNVPGAYLNEAEFRIASVMDYTADFTGRFAGLGKYDQAAINFAYAEAVEAWTPEVMGQLTDFYDTELWLSDYREIPRIMAGAGGTGLGSPEQIKAGIENIKNGRTYIPITTAMVEKKDGILTNTTEWKRWRGELDSGASAQPPSAIYIDRTVPYEFCSDEYNGAQLNCDVFDWGANQREIVNHAFTNYRLFQTFRRYSRYRIYKGYENISSYQNWVISTFNVISNPFRYYSIYQWYDLGSYTDDLREAAIDSVNFYAEVLATPEAGRYCLYNPAQTSVNAYWWYDLTDVYAPAGWDRNDGRCSDYIDIGRGWGQQYNYSFTNEYDYRINRVGTFVDKSIATVALFDISSSYLYSSFFTDFRATNISYWTLFKDEMYDFFRGVILGDYKGFAGVYNPQTSSYEPPKLVDQKTFGLGLPSDQANMKRVYTSISFGHEFNMLVGAMIYNNTWQDRYSDFGQYAKIYASTDESFEVPAGTDVREFVHPVTNQIYRAPVAADGRSITAELVDWANVLRARYVEQKANLDAATPGTTDYQNQREILESRSQQLEEVVAKMDMIRYIWGALGPNSLK